MGGCADSIQANTTWVMHEDTLNKVRNENSAGSQVDVVTDRQGTTIMGRPVITSDYAPDFTGTTSGSESFCVVGDLQAAYTLVVRSPLLIERVDPRYVNRVADVPGRILRNGQIGRRGHRANGPASPVEHLAKMSAHASHGRVAAGRRFRDRRHARAGRRLFSDGRRPRSSPYRFVALHHGTEGANPGLRQRRNFARPSRRRAELGDL